VCADLAELQQFTVHQLADLRTRHAQQYCRLGRSDLGERKNVEES